MGFWEEKLGKLSILGDFVGRKMDENVQFWGFKEGKSPIWGFWGVKNVQFGGFEGEKWDKTVQFWGFEVEKWTKWGLLG